MIQLAALSLSSSFSIINSEHHTQLEPEGVFAAHPKATPVPLLEASTTEYWPLIAQGFSHSSRVLPCEVFPFSSHDVTVVLLIGSFGFPNITTCHSDMAFNDSQATTSAKQLNTNSRSHARGLNLGAGRGRIMKEDSTSEYPFTTNKNSGSYQALDPESAHCA